MIPTSQTWAQKITAPQRIIKGYVLTDLSVVSANDLISFKIQRTPTNGDFWGYSICQELTLEVFSNNYDSTYYQPYVGVDGEQLAQNRFYTSEIKYDEKNNRTTIKGYDLMKTAEGHVTSELSYETSQTIKSLVASAATILDTTVIWNDTQHIENTTISGFNFDGKESFRDLFNEAAKITGTICFIDRNNVINFKQPVIKQTQDLQISKDLYFEQKSSDSYTLTGVVLTTELGDNLEVGTKTGYVQVIRDSPITELITDIERTTILNKLLTQMNGLTMTGYTLQWRGNPALEIGDTVKLQKKDNTYYSVVYLGESLSYTGGLRSESKWEGGKGEDPESNPINIAEAIYTTRAKVDKINHTIDLRVEEAIGKSQTIADLVISVGQIESTVAVMEGDIATIQSRILQLPGEIKLEVEADIQDDFYAKVSSIDIDTDGIEIKSTGSITIDSGADLVISSGGGFEVHTTNFTIDSSGNVSLKGSIQSQSTLSGVTVSGGTVTGSTITGGTVNIGNGNFTVSSNGTVSLAGVASFNPGTTSWYGSSFSAGVDMQYLEIGHINDNNNTPKSNNWCITTAGTGYFTAIEGQHGDWGISSTGTAHGLKAIAVFGA